MIKISKVKEAYSEIESVVGEDYITDKDFMKAAYSRNVDPAFPDRWADMIVRPETTEEVSEIVKIANKYKIKMVPRGGGADLVGGSVTEGGILFDLTRINQIEEFNTDDYYIVVGCGITWGALISHLHPTGYTTGIIGPGSGYSATIGGGLSNATAGGGSTKYGLVPDICLGVEAVLPNPEGTIIRTGSAANKYAQPFCRYGVSPDFTGLFMGDVGTMGIKCKAFLRLFPDPPYKQARMYVFNKEDYNKVFEISHKIRFEINEGLRDLSVLPAILVAMSGAQYAQRTGERIKARGPLMNVTIEAMEESTLNLKLKKLTKIMENEAVQVPGSFLREDLDDEPKFGYDLEGTFHFFQASISPMPPKISMATCHKVPISHMGNLYHKIIDFDKKIQNELPTGNYPGIFASMLYFLPNGNYVVLGGLSGDNLESEREKNMNAWHKKIRHQARYGGAHYWLGESISQSIVESGAFTPEYEQMFRDLKKTVDPNYLLSPNKFHLHTYETKWKNFYVSDEEKEV
ncbi:MAG: FAD-binding oxidoreductase [Candidatus Thorarchaeota archaeon]